MRFQKRNVGLKYLQKYIKKLEPLLTAKKKDRKLIMKNQNLINAVCQGVYNILNGTMPINKETKQKLQRFRSKLHDLSSTEHNSEQKVNLINQTGGLLPILIPSLIAGAGALIDILT